MQVLVSKQRLRLDIFFDHSSLYIEARSFTIPEFASSSNSSACLGVLMSVFRAVRLQVGCHPRQVYEDYMCMPPHLT